MSLQDKASPYFSLRLKVILAALTTASLCFAAYAQDDQPIPTPSPTPKKHRRAKNVEEAPPPVVQEDVATPSTPDAGAVPDGVQLKFNTNSESTNTDVRAPMKFKVPGAEMNGKPTSEETNTVAEDAPFKTYLGYPKHDLSAFVGFANLSAKWTLGNVAFNFTDSPIEYGVSYKFHLSPLLSLHLDWLTYSDSIATSSVIANTYDLNSSSETYNSVFVGGNYCFVSDSNFLRQLCPGIDIGRDDYPILGFTSGSALDLDKVTDITVGVNLAWQIPFADRYLFKLVGGYNMGTGLGNSGDLTSKTNSSYYGKMLFDWNVHGNHTINFQADYLGRTAKLSGNTGGSTQSWETDASMFGGRIGYTYTIQ
jgi:hypothetical protein